VVSSKHRVALVSLAASAVLATAKFVAGLVTGSLGILSEAVHSLIDFGATAITYSAVRFADRPPDDTHHFGHAKAESIAALVETGLLFLTTAWIVYVALSRLFTGHSEIEVTWWAIAIILGSIVIDWNRSRALRDAATAHGSEALAADALHFSSDMWSSAAVIIGLMLAWYGMPAADSIAALVVAGFVALAAFRLGQRTLATLLDAAPEGSAAAIEEAAELTPGVLGVGKVRVRPAGPTLFFDVDIKVRRTLPFDEVDAIKSAFIAAVRHRFPGADVSVTSVPVALDDETVFEKTMLLAGRRGLNVHHLTAQHVGDRLSIALDLEVDGDMPFAAAHEIATALEQDIRAELGSEVEVETHIEPLEARILAGEAAGRERTGEIERLLSDIAVEGPLTDIHNVRVRVNDDGMFVTFHCRVDGARSVEFVHAAVDRLENALRERLPRVRRIIAHAEPLGRPAH
jgi:cation diffusion facilitator family transporter